MSFASESHFFAGLTGNLSEGGVFVATWRKVPVGAPVELVLSLPDGPLVTHGRVAWSRETIEGAAPGLGVAFDDLPDEGRARVEAFCAKRSPWYYDFDV